MSSASPQRFEIFLFALGSLGDIHPNIGVGKELQRRGHRVFMAANRYFEDAVRGSGLEYIGTGDADRYLKVLQDPELWQRGRGYGVLQGEIAAAMREDYRILEERHVPGETIAVAPFWSFGPRLAHEKLGVPLVSLNLQPIILRSLNHQPGLTIPEWLLPIIRPVRKLYLSAMDRWVLDPGICPQLNEFRAELGLPPVSRVFQEWVHSPDRVIGLFPEWFAPPQPDWPPQVRLTGFPLFDEADVRPMPPEAEQFLNSGDRPIAFTRGSAVRFSKDFFEQSAETCEKLGRRGILLTQFPEQVPPKLPRGVRHFSYLPFGALLARVAAFVHHGGMGTLAQALRAGVPQLILPPSIEHRDNAVRARELGVADLLEPSAYSAKTATKKLERLISSPAIMARCREIAQKFQSANWLEQTAELIEEVGAKHARSPVAAGGAAGA